MTQFLVDVGNDISKENNMGAYYVTKKIVDGNQ